MDDNNDNPIIIRPHIVFTDGHQQRQPNHNKTQYVVILWLGLLLFSFVSKHNMWSYYDWIYCCCRPSVNTICGRIMIGLSLLLSVSKHNMWSYYDWVVVVVTAINPIIIRLHIVFTDGRQQRQLNHITTTYCVYWRGLSFLSSVSKHNMWSYYDWVYCSCRPSVNPICGRIIIEFIAVVVRQ
jgi:hypothetical protein